MRMTTSAAAVTLGLLSLNTEANAETLGSWADNTTLGGKSYIDFTHIEKKSDGTKVDPAGNGADVKRFYVIIDHVFNEMWSADLTTDFNMSATTARASSTSRRPICRPDWRQPRLLESSGPELIYASMFRLNPQGVRASQTQSNRFSVTALLQHDIC